jgi:hypothetical protein
MRKRFVPLCGIGLVAALCTVPAAKAQDHAPAADEVSTGERIDPESIPMPSLSFTPDAEIERNYFKYFFFHREATDFHTAFADIQECDGYARGLAFRVTTNYVPTGMGLLPDVVGSVIGNALADAIHGSAERRNQRRVIMRTCMGYKGYATFGLPRDLWREFNFDEGNRSPPEAARQDMLRRQARAASGPRPQIGEIRG